MDMVSVESISFLYRIPLIPLPPNKSQIAIGRFCSFWNVWRAKIEISLFSSICGL